MRSALEDEFDSRLRAEAMAWLNAKTNNGAASVTRTDLSNFMFDGERLPLVDPQQGIRKPRQLSAALSILTTFTRPGQSAPYDDVPGEDGMMRYKWRGEDPNHSDNRALREACVRSLPLIWFVGAAPGIYHAIYPVLLIAEEVAKHQFVVSMEEESLGEQTTFDAPPESAAERAYANRMTRQRLHQPVFRARVLQAYETSCSICRLRHAELLDAAHITADAHGGVPHVSNGLSLCKIHHAAYDSNILGIRPDLVVEIRADILNEMDGPMLRHGLQEMVGVRLAVPAVRADRPDPEALENRYAQFVAAA
ncbi:MAG TPA: HNH endonuclease [Actinospica sp.]|nr:HNH endonuclease [Actinospica sp.]